MARPLRLEYARAFWHLHNRGVNFGDIFFSDQDRELFLELLGETVRRFHWTVIQYSLMTNHYHVILQTPEAPTLSRGMKWFAQTYVQRINRRYRRVGPLFQGRFKAHLIESDRYLLEAIRYVANNPVSARMVKRPEDWVWGSHRAIAGYEEPRPWMTCEPVLAHFGLDHAGQISEYRKFVDAGAGIERVPWDDAVGRLFLGSEAWVERMRALIESKPRSSDHPDAQRHAGRPDPRRVVETVARVFDSSAETIQSQHGTIERQVVAWIGCYESMSRLGKIAAVLRLRSTSRVSSLIRSCDRELDKDRALRIAVDRCLDLLRTGLPVVSIQHLESYPGTDWNGRRATTSSAGSNRCI
jgi:putative transposase